MTLEPNPDADRWRLSREELEFFNTNGYIGPVTIYSPEEMDSIWRSVRRKTLDRTNAAYPIDTLSGATNIANYDRHLDIDQLAAHVLNRKITERVASILGPNVLCWRTEFFPKYPGDEGTDWHQADTFANASGKPQILWPGETESQFGKGTLTVWTAFTDSTRENGCLQIIPGSHNKMNYDETKRMGYDEDQINSNVKNGTPRGFFGYDYRQLQIDPDWQPKEEDAYSLVMQRGQCLIFWSTLMHASLPNISKKMHRMGFAARYVPTSVKVYPDTKVVEEYGGSIPLDKWSGVLAHGVDDTGFNKIAETSLTNTLFADLRS